VTTRKLLFLLLTVIFVSTAANFYLNFELGRFDNAKILSGSWQRVYGHMWVQLVTWALLFFFVWLVLSNSVFKNGYIPFLKGFVHGVFLSSAVGIAAFVLVRVGGFDALGAVGLSSFEMRLGRIGGLSNEPRHLSTFIFVALVFMTLEKRLFPLSQAKTKRVMGVLVVALLGTASTSALIGVVIFFILYLILWLLKRGLRVKRKTALAGILATPVVLLVSWGGWQYVSDNVEKRLASIESIQYYMPKDSVNFHFIIRNPHLMGFGVGAGGADVRIINSDLFYHLPSDLQSGWMLQRIWVDGQYEQTLTPSGALTRFLVDFGLAGGVLLLLLIREFRKACFTAGAPWRVFALVGSLLPAFFALSSVGFFVYVYLVGLLWAKQLAERSRLEQRVLEESNELNPTSYVQAEPVGSPLRSLPLRINRPFRS
jgi:hypothetical protein